MSQVVYMLNYMQGAPVYQFPASSVYMKFLELSPKIMIGQDFEMLWGMKLKIMGRDHGYSGFKNDNFGRIISDFHKIFLKSKEVSIRLSMDSHASSPLSF